MCVKPICPFCGEEMYDLKIYDGIQSALVFLCHCDEYIEMEIEDAFEEAQACQIAQ